MEKQHLVEFFSRELGEIHDSRKQEQGERQALIFAFENLQSQVKEDIERRVTEITYQLNERLTELILNTNQEQPQQLIANLQEQAQTQIDILRDEKKKLAQLFITQLNQIKHKLHLEGKKKDKILEEFAKLKNGVNEIENSSEGSNDTKHQLDEQKSNLASKLTSVTQEREAEELRWVVGLRNKFATNLKKFEVAPEKTVQIRHFKTKFIVRSNNLREHLLNRRVLESKLQLSEWGTVALEPSGVHFIARHKRFDVNPDKTIDSEEPVVLGIFNPTFVWSALAIVLVALAITPFFDSQISKKVSGAFAALGTTELFVTRVGNDLSNLVVDSAVNLPVIFSSLGFQISTDKVNVFSGGVDSGIYVLGGADSWLRAKSEELEGKAKNLSLAFSLNNERLQNFSSSASEKLGRAQSDLALLFSKPLVSEPPSAKSNLTVGQRQSRERTMIALDKGVANAKQNLTRVFSAMINVGSPSSLSNSQLLEAEDLDSDAKVAGASTSAQQESEKEELEGSLLGSTAEAIEELVRSYFKAIGSIATKSQQWLIGIVQGSKI